MTDTNLIGKMIGESDSRDQKFANLEDAQNACLSLPQSVCGGIILSQGEYIPVVLSDETTLDITTSYLRTDCKVPLHTKDQSLFFDINDVGDNVGSKFMTIVF